MFRKLVLALAATMFLFSVCAAQAKQFFPPEYDSRVNCEKLGALTWKDGDDVKCKTFPHTACGAGQVVIADANGLKCGSPINACSGTQVLTAQNTGSQVVFSCIDVLSRLTFNCPAGEILTGMKVGKPICQSAYIANACGDHASGSIWTETCPAGQTGNITKQCDNGVIGTVSNTCAGGSANCGTHLHGSTWTSTCPVGQTGAITTQCYNGTTSVVLNTCTSTPVNCGTHPHGSTWTSSCPSGQTGTITNQCNKGTTNVVSNTCTTIPTCPAMASRSCINSYCSGSCPVMVYPIRSTTHVWTNPLTGVPTVGRETKYPYSCNGTWSINTSNGNFVSSCSTGWVKVINCKLGSYTFPSCPSTSPMAGAN